MDKINGSYETEINLSEICKEFWRKKIIIMLISIILIGISFFVTKFVLTPQYTAVSKVYIINKSYIRDALSLSDVQSATQLLNDCKEIAISRPVLERLKSSLNLAEDVEDIEKNIKVTSISDTRILEISVTGEDPEFVAEMANKFQEESSEQIVYIMSGIEVKELESAIVPKKPTSLSSVRNSLISGFLGIFMCCIFIFFRYMLDDTIKSEADIEKYLDIAVFGVLSEHAENKNKKNHGKWKKRKGSKK